MKNFGFFKVTTQQTDGGEKLLLKLEALHRSFQFFPRAL